MGRSKLRETFFYCLGIILIGCLIQAFGFMKNDRLVFPDVTVILRAFFRLLGDGKTWLKILVTLRHLALSLILSTLIGVALGLAQGLSDTARALFRPMMTMLRALPMIVLTVIVMVLTDYDRVPLAATCLILVPLISEAANEGCRRIDRELIDVYRMNSALNLSVLRHVYLPMTAGYLKQAFVNAVGMGLKLTVTCEYLVQTRDSLGKAVYSSAYFNEYQDIYAYALIMILLVLFVTALPGIVGRLRRRWPPEET